MCLPAFGSLANYSMRVCGDMHLGAQVELSSNQPDTKQCEVAPKCHAVMKNLWVLQVFSCGGGFRALDNASHGSGSQCSTNSTGHQHQDPLLVTPRDRRTVQEHADETCFSYHRTGSKRGKPPRRQSAKVLEASCWFEYEPNSTITKMNPYHQSPEIETITQTSLKCCKCF